MNGNLVIAYIICPDGHRQRVMVGKEQTSFERYPMRCNYPIEVRAPKRVAVTVEAVNDKGKRYQHDTGQMRTTDLGEYRPCGKPCGVVVTNEPVLLTTSGSPHDSNRLNTFEDTGAQADAVKEQGGEA